MGTYRALLVCVFLLAPACAQQARTDQFKVEGTVVNSLTGKPMPRVLVQVSGRSALTGAEGEFSFPGVPSGRVYLALTKPGYFRPGSLARGWSPDAMVDIGPDTGRLVLKMAPEAVIFGQITGQDEEPLEGVSVQVLTRMTVEGRQVLSQAHAEARTDEDGNFRLASLPAGRYYLAIKAGSAARRILGAQKPRASAAYPAIVYYPEAADLAGAAAIELAAGQKMEARFSLTLGPAYKLAGKVAASGEWKRLNPPIIVDSMDQHLLSSDQFDAASGAFEFRNVPAGNYSLRLSGSDSRDRYHAYEHRITVSKDVNGATFLLRPGSDIPVVTRLEFSKPRPAGSCVWGQPNGPDQHSDCSNYPAAGVDLISLDTLTTRATSDYLPMDDPSTFVVHGVAPGRYMVRARATLGGYVQSVRSGNVDLLREALTVPEDGTVAPIEVVLRDDPGTLKVAVRAEKPGQAAAILVFMDGALFPTLHLAGNTSADVYFPPIPPGDYKVLAFDTLNGFDYGNPEILAQYASKAVSVTVAANGSVSVAVDVIHVGE